MRKLKTEHSGPKRGFGAFHGKRYFAKAISNRQRRENGKAETNRQLSEVRSAHGPVPTRG